MTSRRDERHAPDPGKRPGADEDDPLVPERSRDDSDVGWGDEPGERDEDWYRRERPPHHG